MNPKNIVWNENHTPVSTHFDDVYFNNDDAIAETGYVFIDGNQLAERFSSHGNKTFIIGETGFGSGLNFLIAWQFFLHFKAKNPNHLLQNLQFVSIEKYPLTIDEMTSIHQTVISDSNLYDLAKQLQISWPNQYSRFGSVELQIFFTDIEQFGQMLDIHHINIDAWFFDGFSPAKNSAMWSEELFTKLYQHTDKKGSFATFTAASQVRRNLINAGFKVNKRKGYGKKREMLIGYK